jgi:predicted nucleotidyltransferase
MKQKIYRLTDEEKQWMLKRLAGSLERRDDVLFAYAYGSFAEDIPFHDIDVGVYVSNIDQASALEYAVELMGELEGKVRVPIDVRILNFAPVLFLYHVVRGLLIFERDADLRADITERTVRKYLDIKPFIRRGIKEAFAA